MVHDWWMEGATREDRGWWTNFFTAFGRELVYQTPNALTLGWFGTEDVLAQQYSNGQLSGGEFLWASTKNTGVAAIKAAAVVASIVLLPAAVTAAAGALGVESAIGMAALWGTAGALDATGQLLLSDSLGIAAGFQQEFSSPWMYAGVGVFGAATAGLGGYAGARAYPGKASAGLAVEGADAASASGAPLTTSGKQASLARGATQRRLPFSRGQNGAIVFEGSEPLAVPDGVSAAAGASNPARSQKSYSLFNAKGEPTQRALVGAGRARESAYSSTQAKPTAIYRVRNAEGDITYVGQTDQLAGTAAGVQRRFGQHLNKKPHWTDKHTVEMVERGDWTPFEAAAHETKAIVDNGGWRKYGGVLENDKVPITPKKFERYKHLHSDYDPEPYGVWRDKIDE